MVQSLGWEDPLEKGMATHSSIFVCRNPTEKPAGLSSIGLQSQTRRKQLTMHAPRVENGHDYIVSLLCAYSGLNSAPPTVPPTEACSHPKPWSLWT